MDINLHVKKALEHIERILGYYPFVQEEGKATVGLTREDWQVVCDALFYMNTPKEVFPEAIQAYELQGETGIIILKTADCTIQVEMF